MKKCLILHYLNLSQNIAGAAFKGCGSATLDYMSCNLLILYLTASVTDRIILILFRLRQIYMAAAATLSVGSVHTV
jgi:hypothetical protein